MKYLVLKVNNGFSGSIELFDTIKISGLESKEDEKIIYNEILNAIKNVVKKCIESIDIPVYIMHHDDIELINVRTGEIKNIAEF